MQCGDDRALALALGGGAENLQLIREIRRRYLPEEEEEGVGGGLSARELAQTTNSRGLAMRSIERLAGDLYGGEIHFVLELVQNADDNHYAPAVQPTLEICLKPGKIGAQISMY
jgi:hypothetical protein